MSDAVNHPSHYTSHPSGIECIDIVEHLPFSVGNAIKYLWRAGLKGDEIEDLRKAAWYVNREIERRTKAASADDDHEPNGSSREKCVRCGWVMGMRPLNCMNDDTPHVFPSQMGPTVRLDFQVPHLEPLGPDEVV